VGRDVTVTGGPSGDTEGVKIMTAGSGLYADAFISTQQCASEREQHDRH
jgi:hypothetical protein